jgi:hypothetical protein
MEIRQERNAQGFDIRGEAGQPESEELNQKPLHDACIMAHSPKIEAGHH